MLRLLQCVTLVASSTMSDDDLEFTDRASLWRSFLRVEEVRRRFAPGIFGKFAQVSSPDEKRIRKDITRTFPGQSFFGDDERASVMRIVNAYSMFDNEIGYSQGMCFLAGVLRQNFDEETAFWAFVVLLSNERYNMRSLFDPESEALQQCLQCLQTCLTRRHPDLASHLARHGVDMSMFAPQWFLTLFIYRFPLPFGFRFWQAFLAEGVSAVVRVGVALLFYLQDRLLPMNFDSMIPFFNQLDMTYINEDEVFDGANMVDLSPEELGMLHPFGFARPHQQMSASDVALEVEANAVRLHAMSPKAQTAAAFAEQNSQSPVVVTVSDSVVVVTIVEEPVTVALAQQLTPAPESEAVFESESDFVDSKAFVPVPAEEDVPATPAASIEPLPEHEPKEQIVSETLSASSSEVPPTPSTEITTTADALAAVIDGVVASSEPVGAEPVGAEPAVALTESGNTEQQVQPNVSETDQLANAEDVVVVSENPVDDAAIVAVPVDVVAESAPECAVASETTEAVSVETVVNDTVASVATDSAATDSAAAANVDAEVSKSDSAVEQQQPVEQTVKSSTLTSTESELPAISTVSNDASSSAASVAAEPKVEIESSVVSSVAASSEPTSTPAAIPVSTAKPAASASKTKIPQKKKKMF